MQFNLNAALLSRTVTCQGETNAKAKPDDDALATEPSREGYEIPKKP